MPSSFENKKVAESLVKFNFQLHPLKCMKSWRNHGSLSFGKFRFQISRMRDRSHPFQAAALALRAPMRSFQGTFSKRIRSSFQNSS